MSDPVKAKSWLLSFLVLSLPCCAQPTEESGIKGLDSGAFPFFQFTSVVTDCPVPLGPSGSITRAEDSEIAQEFKTTQKVNQLYTHSPLVNSSLWATVQGRIVTIEGCVAGDVPLGYDHAFIRTQIETMVKAVPNVLRVEVLIRTGAQARAGRPVPYRIRP